MRTALWVRSVQISARPSFSAGGPLTVHPPFLRLPCSCLTIVAATIPLQLHAGAPNQASKRALRQMKLTESISGNTQCPLWPQHLALHSAFAFLGALSTKCALSKLVRTPHLFGGGLLFYNTMQYIISWKRLLFIFVPWQIVYFVFQMPLFSKQAFQWCRLLDAECSQK